MPYSVFHMLNSNFKIGTTILNLANKDIISGRISFFGRISFSSFNSLSARGKKNMCKQNNQNSVRLSICF